MQVSNMIYKGLFVFISLNHHCIALHYMF